MWQAYAFEVTDTEASNWLRNFLIILLFGSQNRL